ncbi:hypothetical protein HNQ51_000124 [Inhella inkyongensis]|uniref:Uncharacterized protein n=1 Tax=Inhella inkyongensis TaxID=392593 RepID=A0A840S2C3_9BURK|nr:hypothetical protein [Inhella inkyongensis]MBB5202831.1 hypothetical protein [Inhella inkyongensis]
MAKVRHTPESPTSPVLYFRLRQGKAAKLSPHAKGEVTYDVLTDAQRSDVFISICSAASSAYFSSQPISVSAVESVVTSLPVDKAISANSFKHLYVNRSVNNPGFLACALVGEALLGRVPDKAHGMVNQGNWGVWKDTCLASFTDDLEVVTFGPKANGEAESAAPAIDTRDDAATAQLAEQLGEEGETGKAGAAAKGKARRRGKAQE